MRMDGGALSPFSLLLSLARERGLGKGEAPFKSLLVEKTMRSPSLSCSPPSFPPSFLLSRFISTHHTFAKCRRRLRTTPIGGGGRSPPMHQRKSPVTTMGICQNVASILFLVVMERGKHGRFTQLHREPQLVRPCVIVNELVQENSTQCLGLR